MLRRAILTAILHPCSRESRTKIQDALCNLQPTDTPMQPSVVLADANDVSVGRHVEFSDSELALDKCSLEQVTTAPSIVDSVNDATSASLTQDTAAAGATFDGDSKLSELEKRKRHGNNNNNITTYNIQQ